jgi:flavodoxin
MNCEVRYLSKSGNTKSVAEAIAAAVGVSAKAVPEPVAADTDLLFLGGAVYAFGIDDGLKNFIETVPATVKRAAVFSTAALVKSAYPQIKKLLVKRGIAVDPREFHCRGRFKFMHKSRPDARDLQAAAAFAEKVRDSQ